MLIKTNINQMEYVKAVQFQVNEVMNISMMFDEDFL